MGILRTLAHAYLYFKALKVLHFLPTTSYSMSVMKIYQKSHSSCQDLLTLPQGLQFTALSGILHISDSDCNCQAVLHKPGHIFVTLFPQRILHFATAKTSPCPGHTALYVLGPHGSAEMSALVAPPVSTGGARGARSYHSSSRATPATQDRTDMVQGGSPAITLGRCCFCFVHCTFGKEVIFNPWLAIQK